MSEAKRTGDGTLAEVERRCFEAVRGRLDPASLALLGPPAGEPAGARTPVLPVLVRGLSGQGVGEASVSARCIADLARHGGDVGPAVVALARHLDDPDPTVPGYCASALRHYALRGGDLSDARGVLVGATCRALADGLVQLDDIRVRMGGAVIRAIGAVERAPRHDYFRCALSLLERELSADDPQVRERASAVLLDCAARPEDHFACAARLVPALVLALDSHDALSRLDAATALHDIAGLGADLTPAVVPLAALLDDVDGRCATHAGDALRAALRFGCDLGPAVPALRTALAAPQRWSNPNASRALSEHLASTGEEPPLPSGCSHRRIYARTDDPLPRETRTCPCRVCGSARTVCIHADGVGSNAGCEWWWEFCCLDCGRYTMDEYATG